MIKKIQVTIPAQTFQIDIEIDGVTPPTHHDRRYKQGLK